MNWKDNVVDAKRIRDKILSIKLMVAWNIINISNAYALEIGPAVLFQRKHLEIKGL